MSRLRKFVFLTALAFAWTNFAYAEESASYTLHQVISMKQAGAKPDLRCEVIAIDKDADGKFVYKMKVQATGQIMTVRDKATPPPAGSTPYGKTTPANVTKASTSTPVPMIPDVSEVPEVPAADVKAPTAQAPMVQPVRPESLPFQPMEPTPALIVKPIEPVRPEALPFLPEVMPKTKPTVVPTSTVKPIETKPLETFVPKVMPRAATMVRDESVNKFGGTLHEALLPSHREIAAEQLLECCNPKNVAEVRSLLISAAKHDPAGSVRASCIRCLAKLGVRDAEYDALIATAMKDTHPRVKEEVQFAQSLPRLLGRQTGK